MMRRNVTFVITLLVMALAAIGVTSLVSAQSIFLPALHSTSSNAVGAEADEQLPPIAFPSPPPGPSVPVEVTDLVPDLPDEQKTQVVFQGEDGELVSFYVAYRDHDAVNELIAQYGALVALYEPIDRLYPDGNAPEEMLEDYVSDPNFVHPDPEMPSVTPEPRIPLRERLEQRQTN
jgi:hypothetical protein